MSSDHVDQDGYITCVSCKKKKPAVDANLCMACDKFVCTSCSTYHKQLPAPGHYCKKCNQL